MPLARPLEEHPELDWDSFAVFVEMEDIPRLHDILDAITPAELRRKRHAAGRAWRRLLWTQMYGSYLGESGEEDALETLMGVLRWRLPGLGRASDEELRHGEEEAHAWRKARRGGTQPMAFSKPYEHSRFCCE